MVTTVADRIAEIRRTRKRPSAVVRNWMRREPRWLREAIAEEWQRQTGDVVAPSIVPASQSEEPKPRYWWQDD